MKSQNRRTNNPLLNHFKMFIVTTLTAILIAAILLVISAFLLDKVGLNESQANLLIYAVYILSALFAGLIAGKWQREKKFMWGALAGLVWLVVVFAVSVARNGFGIDMSELFPAVICMLGGGMLGGMLA